MNPALLDSWNIATILAGGISTLAIFSFLIKENPFFRFFEHLFIGIAAGYLPVVTVKTFLWPQLLEPMLGMNLVTYPDGTASAPWNPYLLLYLIPLAFGCLYYFIYSTKHAWLAKLVIGFSLGASAGLGFQGFFAEMIPQLSSSFKPLLVPGQDGIDWIESFNNALFVFTLLSVMYYFFFSFRGRSQVLERVSHSGRWLMMVCFGAFFGSTVMARMALLVERLQFLLTDWYSVVRYLVMH